MSKRYAIGVLFLTLLSIGSAKLLAQKPNVSLASDSITLKDLFSLKMRKVHTSQKYQHEIRLLMTISIPKRDTERKRNGGKEIDNKLFRFSSHNILPQNDAILTLCANIFKQGLNHEIPLYIPLKKKSKQKIDIRSLVSRIDTSKISSSVVGAEVSGDLVLGFEKGLSSEVNLDFYPREVKVIWDFHTSQFPTEAIAKFYVSAKKETHPELLHMQQKLSQMMYYFYPIQIQNYYPKRIEEADYILFSLFNLRKTNWQTLQIPKPVILEAMPLQNLKTLIKPN